MKQKKKICIRFLIIILLSALSVLLFLVCKKGRKYPFTYSETSLYLPIAGGEMLELTEDGGVLRYSNTGEKTLLLELSDIRYLSVLYEKDSVYTLSVHEDGTLALGKDFYFQEKIIGNSEGVRKAELQLQGMVALTEKGEVYEGKILGTWSEFYNGASENVELIKVEGLPEVTDISVTGWDSVCLTPKGEVWAKGEFLENHYEEYTKIFAEVPMVQISNAGNTILALDEAGTVYEVGMVLDEEGSRYNNEQFEEVLTYGKAVQIYGCGERAVLFNKDSIVHYFGHIEIGKGSGESWGGNLKNLKDVRQVFIWNEYIYVLCEDYLYIRKEPLSKRF